MTKSFADSRLLGSGCIYCGLVADTRDHVPSKVFLDRPYPLNLRTVDACHGCNQGFSLDEEYFATILGCTLAGTANPSDQIRPKTADTLAHNTKLRERIQKSREESTESITFEVDASRVRNVLIKLARGHVALELSVAGFGEPDSVGFQPRLYMAEEQLLHFETPPLEQLYCEVGTEAFIRQIERGVGVGWNVVQEGRYRFLSYEERGGFFVRVVFCEYLFGEVIWENP